VSQGERRARRASKVVLQLYREHDAHAKRHAENMGASCKEGCAHCCKLPATATIPEMVPVVDYMTQRPDWAKRRPTLERAITHQLTEYAGVNVLVERERVAFFRRQLPCVFLTPSDRCEIYPVRPTVCRYHMVVSPPERCEASTQPQEVSIIDMKEAEQDIAVKGAEAFGELTGGPIALAFVIAADMLGVKLAIDRSLERSVTLVRMKVTDRGYRYQFRR
jgi:Fe-S-cluster containining protein